MAWLRLPEYREFVISLDQLREDTLKAIATRAREKLCLQRQMMCTLVKIYADDRV
jgi:uncharacterized OsmC-like protein